jgi:hypothetical protein
MTDKTPNLGILLTSALAFLGSAALHAQTTTVAATSPPVTPSAGLLNDWVRERQPESKDWDLGGQFRTRFEHKERFAVPGVPGAFDFRDEGGEPANTYWLFRTKIHLGYSPTPGFTAYVEGRDSFTLNDERQPDLESDRFDVHQAWVRLGNPQEFPLSLKVGRQELIYGDERVIGAFDWNNIGRVFDAVKVRFDHEKFWVDAFTGRVVLADDHELNLPNDYDWFSGLYASARALIPVQETQLYVLARNTGLRSPAANAGGAPQPGGPPARDIYTVGLRVKSLPGKLGPWDYSAELAGQLGRFRETAGLQAGKNLDHRAFAVHAGGGYAMKHWWGAPRLGVEYNFGSGDDNAADGDHATFENLFPTNHKFYGYMDFVSWQNIHNPRASLSLKPDPKLTVTADYHLFWLADTQDNSYTVAGARRGGAAPTAGAGYGINAGNDSYVGSELDLIATYAIKPHTIAQLGYGHFFVGDYVRQSLSAHGFGSTDADFVYVQLVFNF